MIQLTDEQKDICSIEGLSNIGHMSIVACAGSGKTLTATRRLLEIYKLLGHKESIALFSYSNVAVSTFYNELNTILAIKKDNPIHISTFDSFLTEFIVTPHGKRKMGCVCSPFLISGSESFLEWPNYKIWIETSAYGKSNKIPFRLDELYLKPADNKIAFYVKRENVTYDIEPQEAWRKIKLAGKLGGYTHVLRNLWAALILDAEPRLVDIISKKFPYMLIDEAQDIGFLHAYIVEKFSQNSKVTLIGDPNQAIYSFAHADGSFLQNFASDMCTGSRAITCNWRSIEPITTLASRLSGTMTTCKRLPQNDFHGVFYSVYEQGMEGRLVDDHSALLVSKGYELQKSVVLCRSNNMVDKVLNKITHSGTGCTKRFAESAIERDTHSDPRVAFNKLIVAIFSLIKEVPADIPKKISNAHWDADILQLRRALWEFWRSPETGLPSSSLSAKSEWLLRLKENLEIFLPEFSELSGLQLKDSWGRSIRSNKLPDGSLYAPYCTPDIPTPSIRIDTVHKVKGESLDSVLYVVTKSHFEAFLEGTNSEDGRIGYVALTRARDLFVIAIPASCLKPYEAKLAELNIAPLPQSI
jgi:superfamily I DNA/RNA helicase